MCIIKYLENIKENILYVCPLTSFCISSYFLIRKRNNIIYLDIYNKGKEVYVECNLFHDVSLIEDNNKN